MRDGYCKKDENTRTRENKVNDTLSHLSITNHAWIFPQSSSLEDDNRMPADDSSMKGKSSKGNGKTKKTDR